MAVNYAKKFEKATSDLLVAKRKSQAFTNQNYNWTGVNSIVVTTLTDPVIGAYTPSGSNRYGSPTEVEDTEQEWTLSRDRAWTKTIDKKSSADKMMIKKPGKYLAQATKNVLVPEIDTYIFSIIGAAIATAAIGDNTITAATTSLTAYKDFTNLNAAITNSEVPEEGRVAAVTPTFYNFYKQSNVLDASDLGLKDRKGGVVGMIDGVKIILVPASRMPANTDVIIGHPGAVCAPEKLVDYTLHNNPPGLSGDLLEYRHRYDAFVDTNWAKALARHKTS
jgi:hypothetical protein